MIELCAFADEASSSLDGQIFALKKHGISKLELRSINGKNVSDFTDEEAFNYYTELKNNGIDVWSIGSPLGKVDLIDAEEHLKKVERVCQLAEIFKTDKVRIFSFYNAYSDKNKVFDFLAKMCDIAKRHGVTFYHENEREIYGDTVERVQEIIDLNMDGLKFVFDPANYIMLGEDVGAGLDKLFDKTDYFHIKDAIFSEKQIVPSGYGEGKIDEIVKKITLSGKDFVLTLEPHLKVFDGYGQIDRAELKNKFTYSNNDESFSAAVNALKDVLKSNGYTEIVLKKEKKGWVK